MSHRKYFLPFLIILLHMGGLSKAQQLRRPLPGGYAGFGAYSVSHSDAFSFVSNQASLARLKKAAAGIYAEKRYMLRELNNSLAAVALPTSSGNFGFKGAYFGFSDYNETEAGLAYARSLGSKADLGVQFNYHGISIAGYGNDATVSIEIGTIIHLTEKVHGGIHLNNPAGGRFGKNRQEKLASVYSFGLGYDASEKLFVGTEIIKEEERNAGVSAGIQYKILPILLLRAGLSTHTSTTFLGAGLSLKAFRIDLVTAYHSRLGVTPGVMMLFHFNHRDE